MYQWQADIFRGWFTGDLRNIPDPFPVCSIKVKETFVKGPVQKLFHRERVATRLFQDQFRKLDGFFFSPEEAF